MNNSDSRYFSNELMKEAVRLAGEHKEYLHSIPEMAFSEFRTTEYIRKVCEEYPVKIIDTGMKTGLVCLLDAGADETIALRTDIDAVPTEHGLKHLCGHDAHTGSMLGAIHYLCGMSNRGRFSLTHSEMSQREPSPITHNVLFIFQPAEEGTRGAREMLDHGLLSKVPQRPLRIFGIHNRPEVPVGDIVVHRGALMSEKSVFSVTFRGVVGHGSTPHKCIDPIVAAGSFICGIQTVISRNVNPFMPAICTVSSVKAGTSESSAPETAVLTGYIRSFDHGTHTRMEERVRRLAESTAEAYECSCEAVITHMVPAVVNSDEMYETAFRAADTALDMAEEIRSPEMHPGEEDIKKRAGSIVDSDPCLASEDFAVYSEELPSFLYWVGSGTPGRKNAPWHDPEFCIDPRYFETAVPLLCASALTE